MIPFNRSLRRQPFAYKVLVGDTRRVSFRRIRPGSFGGAACVSVARLPARLKDEPWSYAAVYFILPEIELRVCGNLQHCGREAARRRRDSSRACGVAIALMLGNCGGTGKDAYAVSALIIRKHVWGGSSRPVKRMVPQSTTTSGQTLGAFACETARVRATALGLAM
jgi:hypothetical protein